MAATRRTKARELLLVAPFERCSHASRSVRSVREGFRTAPSEGAVPGRASDPGPSAARFAVSRRPVSGRPGLGEPVAALRVSGVADKRRCCTVGGLDGGGDGANGGTKACPADPAEMPAVVLAVCPACTTLPVAEVAASVWLSAAVARAACVASVSAAVVLAVCPACGSPASGPVPADAGRRDGGLAGIEGWGCMPDSLPRR